jgi:acyl CoA:acetate/3-ketoacid CoA transferase beta subunit
MCVVGVGMTTNIASVMRVAMKVTLKAEALEIITRIINNK